MRVNLLLDNPNGIKADYINVDPIASNNPEEVRVKDNLQELTCVDDGECAEIIALDIIDSLPLEEAVKALQNWSKKLGHGGNITVAFTDIYHMAKAIAARMLDLKQANIAIHGTQDKPWRIRRSTFSINTVAKVLESNGLIITVKRLQSGKAIIKAYRP